MKRRNLGIIVAIAVVAAAGFGARARFGGEKPIEIDIEPVATHTIVETVTATGRVEPETEVKISADVSAKITRLHVRAGERVQRGQLLLELDSERHSAAAESAEARLRSSEADVQVAKENLTKAEKDLARTRSLFERSLEPREVLDARTAAYEAEKARHDSAMQGVEQARASRKQAQDDLAKTRIYAPAAGIVSRLNKEAGEIALGSQFQEDVIMVLSNLSGMEAIVDVDENDVPRLSLGDLATIEVDALPHTKLTGVVTEIASSAKISAGGTSDQRTEFEVKIAIKESASGLKPGMSATAEIVTETADAVIGVPIQSVAVRTPDQLGGDRAKLSPDEDGFVQVVFVEKDGAVEARPVSTGIQSRDRIQVLSGLATGEHVVVGSYRAIAKDLKNGAKVAVKPAPVAS